MEGISKINLPKGDGCVTCAPLVLQLRNRLSTSAMPNDYATIRAEIDPLDPNYAQDTLHNLKEIEIAKIEEEIKNISQ